MKKNILILTLISVFYSCSDDSEKIFKGQLKTVEKSTTDKLIGEKIDFDSLYAGHVFVCNSFISFKHHNYGDYFVATFDINTGKHIGNSFKIGQAAEEFADYLYFLHPDSGCDFWIKEFNRQHYLLVDIVSGKVKKRIDLSDFKKTGGSPFIQAFILNDSVLLAVNQPEVKNLDDDVMTPKYWYINYLSKEEIDVFELYDENLYNKLRGGGIDNNRHLTATYYIKPDKSKVVGVMNRFYQINILDVKTQESKGYRLAGTLGFELIRTYGGRGSEEQYTYRRAAVDDEYIFVMLNNLLTPEIKPIFHVFDWEGNFVRVLEVDQNGTDFDLDRAQKKLYTKDDEENVWFYDVSFLYKRHTIHQ